MGSDDQYRQPIEYFSVCLKLFLLFKNSIINKYGLVHYKVLIVFRKQAIGFAEEPSLVELT